MVYTPVKTIVISNNRLTESTDLTKALSTFIGKNAHLVVDDDRFPRMISLSSILTFVPGLDLTKAVATAFTGLFSNQFFTRFASKGIPQKTRDDFYAKRLNVFNPVSYKNHKVSFTSVNTPHIRDDSTKKGYLDDLVIVSKEDMRHYLVAVNGVFHKTSQVGDELFVHDGFRTMRLKGRQDVTVVDTRALGGHTIIPLTASNVVKAGYQKEALVKLGRSVVGKTVFAVIDGYFYHLDHDVIEYVAADQIRIKTNKLPLIQQFRHNPRTLYRPDHYGSDAPAGSRKYKDPYEAVFLNRTYVDADSLKNADFQYSRLTAYHSFLVVVDNSSLFTLSTDLVPTGTPQFYHDQSSRSLSGMMNYGCGLSPSYIIWRDAHRRSSIFLSEQDSDSNWLDGAINAHIIPPLYAEPNHQSSDPAKLIDYVCA